jgi:putative peptidoglycan lipid II flippase
MATSLSATMNALLLYLALSRAQVYQASSRTFWLLGKIVLACMAMAYTLAVFTPDISDWLEFSLWIKILQLMQLIAIGGAVFTLSLVILGVRKSSFSVAQLDKLAP